MTVETAADVQEVLAVTSKEARAITTGDLALYRSILSDSAVFLPPNSMPLSGNELRLWLGDFLDHISIEYVESADGRMEIRGDLAWHEYTCAWTAMPRSGGASVLTYFKGLHILERCPGDTWKIVRNIWNTSPAPA